MSKNTDFEDYEWWGIEDYIDDQRLRNICGALSSFVFAAKEAADRLRMAFDGMAPTNCPGA